jgi:probable HAF family extracellular repeat protein
MNGSRSSTALLARVAAISLLMLSALATDVTRGAAPSYIVTDLGIFGNLQTAEALELNEAGQVVGRAGARPFLWQNGSKTDLGTLGGGASASALNEGGQIVGYSALTPGGPSRAVLWDNGTITNLTPDLGSTDGSAATGINEAGQIVANIGYGQAFLWQNGARTSLGHLGGGASFVQDINDSGIAVGSSYTNDMTPLGLMQHPFKWQNGVMTNLGLLPGDEDGGATAINSAGQIVGSSGRTDFETYESFYKPFLYSNGVMTAIPVPSTEAYGGDINESGTIIVGSMRAGGGFSNFHGWIYQDGVVSNLNHLIPQNSGLHIAYAYAVNEAGQIAATAFDAQGHRHAVLLTPGTAPAPSPGITVFDVSVTEGNSGSKTVSFYVRLSFESTSDVTMTYSTANGTATAGSDYTATSGTVTIPAGQLIRTIDVTVTGDRKREADEAFYLNLANLSGATLADGQAVGTLRNDDK